MQKFLVKLKKIFFAETIVPSESTFSDLYNDTKIIALAAVFPEKKTFYCPILTIKQEQHCMGVNNLMLHTNYFWLMNKNIPQHFSPCALSVHTHGQS